MADVDNFNQVLLVGHTYSSAGWLPAVGWGRLVEPICRSMCEFALSGGR